MPKDTYLRVLVPVERVSVEELPRVPVLVPDERVLVVPDVRTRVVVVVVLRAGVDDDCVDVLRVEVDC